MKEIHPTITYAVFWRTATEDWRQFGERHRTVASARAELEAVLRNPRCRAARILRYRETAEVIEEVEGEETGI